MTSYSKKKESAFKGLARVSEICEQLEESIDTHAEDLDDGTTPFTENNTETITHAVEALTVYIGELSIVRFELKKLIAEKVQKKESLHITEVAKKYPGAIEKSLGMEGGKES
jgi:hypothetical protein